MFIDQSTKCITMANHRGEDDYDEDFQLKKELESLIELAEIGIELNEELREIKNSKDPIDIEFFKHIIQFKNVLKRLDIHPIMDMLGNPDFPKVQSLNDDDVVAELDKVNEMLAAKRIYLELIYPTAPREVYRFITEELIYATNGYVNLVEMSFEFTYEEFYPNHPESIKDQIESIIESIAEKDFHEATCGMKSAILFKNELHDEYLFFSEINQHLEIFDELTDPKIEFIELEILEDIAIAKCGFTLIHETSNGERVVISPTAKFKFEICWGAFVLSEICVPEMGM